MSSDSIVMADDWDEIFAMAAGKGSNEESLNNYNNNLPADSADNNVSGGEGKRISRTKRDVSSISSFPSEMTPHPMLEGRMDFPGESSQWPSWIEIGGSLMRLGPEQLTWCQKFESSSRRDYAKCDTCQKSAFHHQVFMTSKVHENIGDKKRKKPSKNDHWPLGLFCSIRNIRNCSKIVIKDVQAISSSLKTTLRAVIESFEEQFSAALSYLPEEEATLLKAKADKVIHFGNEILNSEKPGFDDLVRLVIHCDGVYYRLYYLQLTNQLPICMVSSQLNFIPHPPAYFGLNGLTSDSTKDYAVANKFVSEIVDNVQQQNSGENNQVRLVESILERTCGVSQIPSVEKDWALFTNKDHPLSALRRYRFLETLSLFYQSGWWKSFDTQHETMKALSKTEWQQLEMDEEETPAPSILMEWRNSCRDLVCNLYAYATLSPTNLKAIEEFLEFQNITEGIVEYGAGTGYLAKVLNTNLNVGVRAYDVSPTGGASSKTDSAATVNEYHGQTPPFIPVYKGSADTFKQDLQCLSIPAENVALLLCYPPPGSPMAYDILMEFLRCGGKCFIHIGEFHGLTGSGDFQSFLVENFQCEDRQPCLSWGTDAAEVSMWTVKDCQQMLSSKRLLLPCSFCGKVEAKGRCRLLRYIVYCSEGCCRSHCPNMLLHLNMHMITLRKAKELYFNDKNHYSLLSSS